MEISARFALAAACALMVATAPAVASEPASHGHSHNHVVLKTNVVENAGAAKKGGDDKSAMRALRARYPARPAEYRADGSIAQYIGASHLMQTAVRIGADGRLEELSTTDAEAVQKFLETTATARSADEAGDKPGDEQ